MPNTGLLSAGERAAMWYIYYMRFIFCGVCTVFCGLSIFVYVVFLNLQSLVIVVNLFIDVSIVETFMDS